MKVEIIVCLIDVGLDQSVHLPFPADNPTHHGRPLRTRKQFLIRLCSVENNRMETSLMSMSPGVVLISDSMMMLENVHALLVTVTPNNSFWNVTGST